MVEEGHGSELPANRRSRRVRPRRPGADQGPPAHIPKLEVELWEPSPSRRKGRLEEGVKGGVPPDISKLETEGHRGVATVTR